MNDSSYYDDWEVIYRSTVPYKVEMLKDLLVNEDIPAVIVNKKDFLTWPSGKLN